ncbi:hypothetical protein [Tateyamaria sp.]|uniref:hypothetical protein n=1 Tax=Tateyamaria sp. TaxID=1929288 RepID=UPI00329FD354
MTLHVTPPRKTLRTDLFKTSQRQSTRGVLIRYSNTINDPRIDAVALDDWDCARGYFGCVSHFIVRTDGRIERGRDPRTISSAPKPWQAPDHIVVTVVGGLDVDAEFQANDTEEQEIALEVLLQAIATALNIPLEITDQRAYLRNKAYAAYLAETGEYQDDDDDSTIS